MALGEKSEGLAGLDKPAAGEQESESSEQQFAHETLSDLVSVLNTHAGDPSTTTGRERAWVHHKTDLDRSELDRVPDGDWRSRR